MHEAKLLFWLLLHLRLRQSLVLSVDIPDMDRWLCAQAQAATILTENYLVDDLL